jgi:hypothetical protein
MKPKNPSEENDPLLSNVLGQWKIDATLPPRFQENVWRRISQKEAPAGTRPSFMGWIETAFKRPALVTSYVTVLLFIGLTTGYLRGHDKTMREQSQERTLYVQSIDPYLVPRH